MPYLNGQRIEHENARHLRLLPCLARLGSEDLFKVIAMAKLRRVEKNTVIFDENDHDEHFYIVAAGSAKLYKASEEGRELFFEAVGPGECIGCPPLHSRGRYCVSAAACESSHMIVLPSMRFRDFLMSRMEETGPLMISCICRRFEGLFSFLGDLAFRDVEERVMLALLKLTGRLEGKSSGLATLSITHSDIASMTGTVREVVSRTMSKLKKERIVTESNVRGFTIDREKLAMLMKR